MTSTPWPISRPLVKHIILVAAIEGEGDHPDDMEIFKGDCPWAMRIVNAHLYVMVGAPDSSVHLRTGNHDEGEMVFGPFDSTREGRVYAPTPSVVLAANSTLVLRRTNNNVAGELFLTLI